MRYAIIMMVMLLAITPFAVAQDQAAKYAFNLNAVEMEQAFTAISQKAQVTILGDSTVKGTVTCNMSNVTVDQALDVICKMNKLEWRKAYANAGSEKLSASSLFKLVDALKELGGSTVICQDPETKSDTVFIPGAKANEVNTGSLASQLNLKPLYLVRALVDPAELAAKKAKEAADAKKQGLNSAPPADPKVAAEQVWGYFNQMPPEQSFQVMNELRHMMFQNMSEEQRHAMFQRMREMGGRDGNRGDRGDHGSRPPQ